MAGEVHPVPSRTRKLSPPAPMVLRSQSVGEQDVADQRGAFLCRRRPGGRAGPPGDVFLASLSPARRRLFVRRPSLCARAPGRARSTWGLAAGAVPGPRRPSGALSFGAVGRGRPVGGPLWLPPHPRCGRRWARPAAGRASWTSLCLRPGISLRRRLWP